MLDFSLSFRSSNSYRERIDELEAQIAQYEKELVDYEQTKHKLESYQSVLGLKEENPDYELLPAEEEEREDEPRESFCISALNSPKEAASLSIAAATAQSSLLFSMMVLLLP